MVIAPEAGDDARASNLDPVADPAPDPDDGAAAPAPEPASLLLVGTGLILLAISSRRWRRSMVRTT